MQNFSYHSWLVFCKISVKYLIVVAMAVCSNLKLLTFISCTVMITAVPTKRDVFILSPSHPMF